MFAWVPIYKELAEKLLEFREDQAFLLKVIRGLGEAEKPVISLWERNKAGEKVDINFIDPFSFFAVFNRGITDHNRIKILKGLKEKFNLKQEVPSEFGGIPVMVNINAMFFPWEEDRNDDDIAVLWDLAESIIKNGFPDRENFNRCLKIKQLGIPKLTVGLYWLAPERVLPYDKNTKRFLADHGIHLKSEDYDGYYSLVETVKNKFNRQFYEISFDAWEHDSDHKLHNKLIADVLRVDRNIPFNDWKEQVDQVLIPIFQDLKEEIKDSGINFAKVSKYRRTTKDNTKEHSSLSSFMWNYLRHPYFGKNNIQFQVGFSGIGEEWEGKIWWGIRWFGKRELTDIVYNFFKNSIPNSTVVREDEIPLFGGSKVSLVFGRYTADEVEALDHDIKKDILFDVLTNTPLIDQKIKELEPTIKDEDITEDAIDEGLRYKITDALTGLFMSENDFKEILEALEYRKNIILQGPPGVGKTFASKRLAYALIGQKNPSRIEMIQFHQSYAYEDFMQGYRPSDDGKFELKNGVFYEFVKKAQQDSSEHPYVFIIDEINRANLGKVFGELMLLIEPDKRGSDYAVPLTYAKQKDDRFYIPKNLYLIGTMNTADRSITIVDYALRRRFAFFSLKPEFNDKFIKHLDQFSVDTDVIEYIIDRIGELNKFISADIKNLGPGFEIGHSFFCPIETVEDSQAWYNRVVSLEIKPLLFEYWFDDPEKADEQAKKIFL